MDNFGQYVDVLIQAPVAVILMVHVYLTNKSLNQTNTRLIDTIEALSKIIKQQERK